MSDILGRESMVFEGAFTADGAAVAFGGGADNGDVGMGLLTQQLGWQYRQPVTRLYEIGRNSLYYVAGRCQGDATMQRVLGPAAISLGFYTEYGNVCNGGTNNLIFTLGTSCNLQNNLQSQLTLFMNSVIITALNGQVQSQDMVVGENVQMMYAALEATAGQPT